MEELLATAGTLFFSISNLPVFLEGARGKRNNYPLSLILFVLLGALCLGGWAWMQSSPIVVTNYVFCFVTWALALWRNDNIG